MKGATKKKAGNKAGRSTKPGNDPNDRSMALDMALSAAVAHQENLEHQVEQLGSTVTALNCRIALRNEMIVGYFEKHFEDCRRRMSIYKKNTVEYKVHKVLLDKLTDIRRDILNC